MNTNVGGTDMLRPGPPSLSIPQNNNFTMASQPFPAGQSQSQIHLPNNNPSIGMMAGQSNPAMINQQNPQAARMARPTIGHNVQPGLPQRSRPGPMQPGSQIPPGHSGHPGMGAMAVTNGIQPMGFNNSNMITAQNLRRINSQPHLQNQANLANMGSPGTMISPMNPPAGITAPVRHPQPPQSLGMGLQSHVSPEMQVGLRPQDPGLPQTIQRSASAQAAMQGQMVNGIPASPSFQGTHNAGMPNSMHQNHFGMPHPPMPMSASPQPAAGHPQSHLGHGNGPHSQNNALVRPLSSNENNFIFTQPNNFGRRPAFSATPSPQFIGGEHQEDHAADSLNNRPGFMPPHPQGMMHMRPTGDGTANGAFQNMPPPQAMSRGPHEQHPNPHNQMSHMQASQSLGSVNPNTSMASHPPRPQSQPQNQPHLPAQPQPHPQPHPHSTQQPGRPPSQADARQTPRMSTQPTPNMGNVQPPPRVPSATVPQGVSQQPQQGPNPPSGPAPGVAAVPNHMAQMLRGRMPPSPSQIYIPPGHIGPGQGIHKLLQLSAKLAAKDKEKSKLSYWEELVRTFFTDTSELKLALFRDAQASEVKYFCLNVAIMPRYFLVTSQAGVESMSLILDGGRERYPESDHCVVECLRAAWTFKYSNGYIVTLRGPLTVHVKVYPVAAQSNALGAPQAATQTQLLIDQIQFDGESHEKSISVDSIIGSRVPEHPFIPRNPSARPGETEKKWDEARLLIERATIPTEPVSPFGVPQPTMRCLELAESVSQMAELIQFSRSNHIGALEGLAKMAANIRQSPSNLPNLSAARPGATSSISAIGASSPSVTLYSSPSGPPSTSTMQSAPTPSPKDVPATVPAQSSPPKPASAKPASAATPGSVVGTPTQASAKVPGTSSTQNTPLIANAAVKRKAPDSSSASAGNADAPNKRVQRKRGKTASGGG